MVAHVEEMHDSTLLRLQIRIRHCCGLSYTRFAGKGSYRYDARAEGQDTPGQGAKEEGMRCPGKQRVAQQAYTSLRASTRELLADAYVPVSINVLISCSALDGSIEARQLADRIVRARPGGGKCATVPGHPTTCFIL